MIKALYGRFREIARTRNAPLLSLESQRHFPRSVGGISLDYATKYTLLRSVYSLTLVAFAAKTAARLRTYFYVPPKLVKAKHASRLQPVNKHYRGWRGVANKGTSPRACGWEEYLPLSHNRRSGARHQPLPYWQFLGRTPLHHLSHFGVLLLVGARPVLGAPFNTYRAKTRRKVYFGF